LYFLKCQDNFGSGIPFAWHSNVKWLPITGVDVGLIEIDSIVGGTEEEEEKQISIFSRNR